MKTGKSDNQMAGSRKNFSPYFLPALLLGALFLLPILWESIGRDQGHYSYVAWAWNQHHLPPHESGNTADFPGIIFLTAFAFKLFGPETFSLRLFDYFFQLVNLALIFYLAGSLNRPKKSGLSGFIALGLYALFYTGLTFKDTAQRDDFALTFLLAALYIYSRTSNKQRYLSNIAGTGLMLGAACLMKPVYAAPGAAFSLLYLFQALRQRQKPLRICSEQFLLLTSFVLPLAASFLVYARLGADLSYYKECWMVLSKFEPSYLTGNKGYLELVKLWDYMLYKLLGRDQVIWIGIIAYFLFYSWRGGLRKQILGENAAAIVMFLWCGAMLFMQGQPDYPFEYHKVPVLGLGCIFSGVFWANALEGIGGDSNARKRLSAVFVAVLFALEFFSFAPSRIQSLIANFSRGLQSAYWEEDPATYKAAEYISSRTSENEYVMAAGSSGIAFVAKRLIPTHHTFESLLTKKVGGSDFFPLQKKWQQEFLRDVRIARPRYLLWTDSLGQISGFRELVDANYFLETEIEGLKVYRIKN